MLESCILKSVKYIVIARERRVTAAIQSGTIATESWIATSQRLPFGFARLLAMTSGDDEYMPRFALFFLFIRLPLDYCVVVAAALTAYFLRFTTFVDWRPAQQLIPFDRYVLIVCTVAIFWVAAFALAGLYRQRRQRTVDELWRVFMASSAAIMAVVILIFFRREFFASRFIVLAAWGLSVLFVAIERICVRIVELQLLKRGYGHRRVAIVGTGTSATALLRAIQRESGLALRVVATHPRFDERAEVALLKERRGSGLDELIVADASLISPADAERLLRFVDETQVGLRYSADLFAARRTSLAFVSIGGVPLLEIKQTPLDGWGRIYKRSFDVVVSFFLLLICAPLMAAISLCVTLNSSGPVFFIRKRVGERGTLFSFFKFRSMRVGAPESLVERKKLSERPGIVPKLKEDPRWVTPFGRFLRRWSLDELPQFWNVLIGDMSLVGPRPHLPEEVADYTSSQKKLLTVRPGLTGLAQISGRADLGFTDEARLDLWYIEHWSPLLDLAILLRTPLVVFDKKGAY